MVKKLAALAATSLGSVVLMAAPAFGHECVNASKPQTAGAQIILDANDNPIQVKKGVEKRIENGLIDPDTGDGLHGIIGFDTGDGTIVSTYIVGPNAEIPVQAQQNGPACRGITNIEVYFSECLG